MSDPQEKHSWLDRPLFSNFPILTNETIIFVLIILLAIFSRLYNLGDRVMSHDENSHVYYSWLFSTGQGYQHTPTTHGPLQFHLIALTFFLFGDNEFTARLPHAIAGVLTIILLWKWRRYLGRAGTLITGALMLVSPFMLYYSRYARNEAFVALFGVMTLFAILRYLETGKSRYLLLLTAATVLHFTAKETAFIYTAQAMLFLGVYLVNRISRASWKNSHLINVFLIVLSVGVVLAAAAVGISMATKTGQNAVPPVTITPALHSGMIALAVLAGLALVAAIVLLVVGYGWKNLSKERSFDMLILLGTFVLPQLAPFPVQALGWNPLDYAFTWPGLNFPALWAQGPFRTVIVVIVLFLISITIGLLWDRKRWLINAALFWGIYVFFYTSVFTNWAGLATGLVGSLGYWLEQQGVNRGNQPWYYYLLIQIPIYEFLPALGLLLAAWFGFRHKSPEALPATNSPEPEPASEGNHTFSLLFWWALSSLVAFTIAGEKMPWLTVHITLPMILLAGWALGQVVERLNRSTVREKRGVLAVILLGIFFIGLLGVLLAAFGTNPPFQGKTLEQLSATATFLLAAVLTVASAGGIIYILTGWERKDALRLAVLVFFGLLFIQTGRSAIRAAYINPNDATEYLVYAHGASGVQEVMAQIARVSNLTAGGQQALVVAYDKTGTDQAVAWPFLWYLRHYRNAKSFTQLSADLQGSPVIILDDKNSDAIKAFIGTDYYVYTYNRIVWPNQDYFKLTWPRIKNVLTNPLMRSAIWQIWFNRNYSLYAKATGETTLEPSDWQPAHKMQLLVRRDIAAQIWDYGVIQAQAPQVDPYEKGKITLASDLVYGVNGTDAGQLNWSRGIALAPDGTLYVADTNNYRIQHFDAEGNILGSWGTVSPGCPYPGTPPTDVPVGTFCEPWGVAVSPDGQWIYVTDTWNHRIQKFTADGKPVTSWGTFGQDGAPDSLYGPRGIAVDTQGRVFVADTGNKRILIYDADGKYIQQIGSGGTLVGQFEEPVGVALDSVGNLYVADTWNQRVQVFAPIFLSGSSGLTFSPSIQWDINGWFGNSNDNKPYLAVDDSGHVFVTDPEGYRVLEFTSTGEYVRSWGDYGVGADQFALPAGIAADAGGKVWVSDAANSRIMRFTLP
jgi:uncharacterized protein (TIGR03663 family)